MRWNNTGSCREARKHPHRKFPILNGTRHLISLSNNPLARHHPQERFADPSGPPEKLSQFAEYYVHGLLAHQETRSRLRLSCYWAAAFASRFWNCAGCAARNRAGLGPAGGLFTRFRLRLNPTLSHNFMQLRLWPGVALAVLAGLKVLNLKDVTEVRRQTCSTNYLRRDRHAGER